ncbi:MAG: penicillin-binding protein activator [Thioalkalivibrio sp.]|nr:MAG: penicillin-binding protein activator [Thioalkalivibrio sp.]
MTLTHSTLSARAALAARILVAGCLGILLAACAAPRPAPAPAAPDPEVIEISPEERAGRLLIEAEATPDPAPARTAIDAVLGLEEPAGDLMLRADRLWTLLPEDGRGTLADRYRGARLAMLSDESRLALERLTPVEESPDTGLYRDALALHAELLTTHGPALDALLARAELDPQLVNRLELQSANQQEIWLLLATLDSAQIRQLDGLEDPGQAGGWIALFRAVRGAGTDPDAFTQAVSDWEREHPRHSGQALLPELRDASQGSIEPPARVAVLLPLSGPLADLGNALLEGIAARFYEAHGRAGSLLVFDTAGQEDLADAAYRNALQQGADRVIGPLVRESVNRVAAIDSSVPTLLLNHPSEPGQGPFWVLSLSPEDDARAVAERAHGLGSHRALVLVPEGSFGDRVAGAFRESYERQSGHVTAENRFEARSPEINARIGAALGVDVSEQRIQRVRRQTGLKLEADAQIRSDIDVVFIAGSAADLRLVVPHLHYHRASRLPMLATSHVYEGRPEPDLDRDLSGIRFPDAPWLHPDLNPEPELLAELAATEDIETTASRLPRFAALGIDAMDVAAELPLYRRAPHLEVKGVAGTWRQHPPTRNWVRQPAWLEFDDGLARPAPMQVAAPRED